MNVLAAAHRIGLEFPGGMTGLAPLIGVRRPGVLRDKLNPNNQGNHLTLHEAMLMQSVTGRYDILYAMADELNHMAIPLPQVGDDNVAHAISTTCAEFGDYLRRVDDAMQDGKITPNEIKALERELAEMIAAAGHLQSLLAGLGKRRG